MFLEQRDGTEYSAVISRTTHQETLPFTCRDSELQRVRQDFAAGGDGRSRKDGIAELALWEWGLQPRPGIGNVQLRFLIFGQPTSHASAAPNVRCHHLECAVMTNTVSRATISFR
ncbi:hypothetical protein Salat_2813200 [Sesamum alatum]|uniref:Uncharacterized protein n=1 Tax=Sesamum alatum TaxID=300844 RepID=A0AAE2C9F8_9LAMI|nr:hypothetical protein Salat_2813200 [Sesamum alatum]